MAVHYFSLIEILQSTGHIQWDATSPAHQLESTVRRRHNSLDPSSARKRYYTLRSAYFFPPASITGIKKAQAPINYYIPQVYVDALGTTTTYEKYLSSLFPGINFTVTTKADSKFKIVGAASVAAKVTRDCCVEGWHFEESEGDAGQKFSDALGSGYPSGGLYDSCNVHIHEADLCQDPNTQAWLKTAIDPVFGFPNIVRFSWTTVKVLLEKHAHAVKWQVGYDLDGLGVLIFFQD